MIDLRIISICLDEYPQYEIYPDGRIFSKTKKKFISPIDREGYKRVLLVNKNKEKKLASVHRIVCFAFIDKPDDKNYVNHKDGNPGNNNVSNLEWVTAEENAKHSIRTGLRKTFMRPVLQYTLNNEYIARYESAQKAAETLNCSSRAIAGVCNGTCKTHKGSKWKYETEYKEYENIEGEEWKLIVGHPNYQISTYGRIWTNKYKRLMNFTKGKEYYRVKLEKKSLRVHRLVALTFLGNPPKDMLYPIVNHKDGDKLNNKLDNLEWLSMKDNSKHAVEIGLIKEKKIYQYTLKGEIVNIHGSAKTAAESVYGKKHNIYAACSKKCSRMTYKGYIWRHEGDPFNMKSTKTGKLKVIQLDMTHQKIKTWNSIVEASRETGIDSSAITKCAKGKQHSAGDYLWQYEDNPQKIKPKYDCKKRVMQKNIDGEIIKEWDSLVSASRATGISGTTISRACRGKSTTSGGYKWEWI